MSQGLSSCNTQLTHNKARQCTANSSYDTYASQGLCKQSIKHTHCWQSSICVTLEIKPVGELRLSLSVVLGSSPVSNILNDLRRGGKTCFTCNASKCKSVT